MSILLGDGVADAEALIVMSAFEQDVECRISDEQRQGLYHKAEPVVILRIPSQIGGIDV